MKIGELAKRSGLSVRTLHYYDEIGLLSPSERTEADHRVYVTADVVRLQQIVSLRQLGFSLDEIRQCLDQSEFSWLQVVQRHIDYLKDQIAQSHQLMIRLERILTQLQSCEPIEFDDLIQTIEVMIMFEKYYTPEQLETLEQRQQNIGRDRIRQVEIEWQSLISELKEALHQGQDPSSKTVQALAHRCRALVQEFTDGDPKLQESLQALYQQEGAEVASRGLIEPAVMEYMGQAMALIQD